MILLYPSIYLIADCTLQHSLTDADSSLMHQEWLRVKQERGGGGSSSKVSVCVCVCVK